MVVPSSVNTGRALVRWMLCGPAPAMAKLMVSGSPVLEELKTLEAKGVRLIACGTCLNYFGLADDLQVGLQGGMTDIIEAQWRAEKVITL